jgi:hypothetical protein
VRAERTGPTSSSVFTREALEKVVLWQLNSETSSARPSRVWKQMRGSSQKDFKSLSLQMLNLRFVDTTWKGVVWAPFLVYMTT